VIPPKAAPWLLLLLYVGHVNLGRGVGSRRDALLSSLASPRGELGLCRWLAWLSRVPSSGPDPLVGTLAAASIRSQSNEAVSVARKWAWSESLLAATPSGAAVDFRTLCLLA